MSLRLLRFGQPDIPFLVHQRKVQTIRSQAIAHERTKREALIAVKVAYAESLPQRLLGGRVEPAGIETIEVVLISSHSDVQDGFPSLSRSAGAPQGTWSPG
jgi:hypothetical protein